MRSNRSLASADAMREWARRRVRALSDEGIAGFVLKKDSPSCGPDGVNVEGAAAGRGLFAQTLIEALPDLPIEDEARLHDAGIRAQFLERVRAYSAEYGNPAIMRRDIVHVDGSGSHLSLIELCHQFRGAKSRPVNIKDNDICLNFCRIDLTRL